jgi:hypothetical protein
MLGVRVARAFSGRSLVKFQGGYRPQQFAMVSVAPDLAKPALRQPIGVAASGHRLRRATASSCYRTIRRRSTSSAARRRPAAIVVDP